LHRITEETSIPWIRVLYCYPDKITDGLIEEMKNNPRILNYIDLPLQHISDNVLRRMNRHGRSAEICEVLDKLRREIPDIVIRTTFIVGFPGETEKDFEELAEFMKEQRFEHAGVFPYSREEGTVAYNLPDQIDEQVKQDRADILMRMQMEINAEQNEKMIGKTVRVLCEDFDPVNDAMFGRSCADAPEIDGKVFFTSEGKSPSPGDFVDVEVDEVIVYDLVGHVK
jgi:ribosomal protein S12 methylthiotransferase